MVRPIENGPRTPNGDPQLSELETDFPYVDNFFEPLPLDLAMKTFLRFELEFGGRTRWTKRSNERSVY